MKQLFPFEVTALAETLRGEFGDKASTAFDNLDEVQCGGCLHKTGRLYVVVAGRREALQEINAGQMGVCGECIADLIATEGWQIVDG